MIALDTRTNYKIGRNDGFSLDFDVTEILAFNEVLDGENSVLQYLVTSIPLGGITLARNLATTSQGRVFLLDIGLRKHKRRSNPS